jgi:hypothetical protein
MFKQPSAPAFSKPDVIELYMSGLSTREVAKAFGIGKSTVFQILKAAGLTRDHNQSAIMAGEKTRIKNPNHKRTCRSRARQVMQAVLGRSLESWEHVHHKDHDFTNNDPSNLEIVSASDHAKLHHPKIWNIPRHQIPARAEYMKRYQKVYRRRHGLE